MLNFLKDKISFEEGVWRTKARHRAKFCQIGPSIVGDITVFWFFKLAVVSILNFWIREILLADGDQMAETHHHGEFSQNRYILRRYCVFFFKFSRRPLPPSCIFEFVKSY